MQTVLVPGASWEEVEIELNKSIVFWRAGHHKGNAGRGFDLSSTDHNGASTVVDGTVIKSGELAGHGESQGKNEGFK